MKLTRASRDRWAEFRRQFERDQAEVARLLLVPDLTADLTTILACDSEFLEMENATDCAKALAQITSNTESQSAVGKARNDRKSRNTALFLQLLKERQITMTDYRPKRRAK